MNMNRKDFFQLLQPLCEKLYRLAYNMIPDDLQAEQLVIDAINAYLIKEKKNICGLRDLHYLSKKDIQYQRRNHLKGIIRYLSEIGTRRSLQLKDQITPDSIGDFGPFFSLDPKLRLTLTLRFDLEFSVEEIGDMTQMPRFEVIEKIHNGRYLLLKDKKLEVAL